MTCCRLLVSAVLLSLALAVSNANGAGDLCFAGQCSIARARGGRRSLGAPQRRHGRGPLMGLGADASAHSSRRRSVAVIGGGLAGLSVTYHMLNITKGTETPLDITIIDQKEVGQGGATGAMAGILHPLTPRGKVIWMGQEGMEASVRLIDVADKFADKPLRGERAQERGVIRLVTKEKQEKDYAKAAKAIPHLVQLFEANQLEFIQGLSEEIRLCLQVKGGCALRGSEYTKALLSACRELGDVNWKTDKVSSIASVKEMGFDIVVVTAGAASIAIDELAEDLPLKCVRGQNVDYVRRPESLEGAEGVGGALGAPIISGKYLVPFEGGSVLCGGATQEEDGDMYRDPDLEFAASELSEPLAALFPPLLQGTWVPKRAVAGVRGLPPRQPEGSIPIVGPLPKCGEGAWIFTGLGSRGLIHHAVLGELLARAIVYNDESMLPAVTRRLALVGGEHPSS